MTTFAEATQAILVAFDTAWNGETPYTLENETTFKPTKGQEWVRVTIRHEVGRQETLGPVGNRKFARKGRVFIQVFTPEGTGTARSGELCELGRNAFEGVTLAATTVRFHGVSTREVGVDKDGWFNALVDAPFEYDETR